MIKKEDPLHPVATVTAGIREELVQAITTRAPAIDIIGVNQYHEDLYFLPESVRKAGWGKPYIVTEFGPPGPWMVKKTSWGAWHEPLPEVKVRSYKNAYKAMNSDTTQCIGSYAFLWGWKWEKTWSWFNLFTHNGRETASLDAVEYGWTNIWPKNRSPVAGEILINGKKADEEFIFKTGKSYTAKVDVWDKENDKIFYEWIVYTESQSKARGGDPENPEVTLEGITGSVEGNSVILNMPDSTGAYRLYVLAYDQNKRLSISNYPFFVEE
jgi:hypothetical protein